MSIKWSRGCSNGSRKNINITYIAGTKIDRQAIKYNKKVVDFWILRSTQWHKFNWIVTFTNSQLSKLGFITPKIIWPIILDVCLQKQHQAQKNYSIFLLQSISCHLKHIIIVWKCLKIKELKSMKFKSCCYLAKYCHYLCAYWSNFKSNFLTDNNDNLLQHTWTIYKTDISEKIKS